jgi:hypothetical protein
MIRQEKAVLEVGADRVLDHPLPQHRPQLPFEVLRRIRVLLRRADVQHAPDTDQDAAAGRVLHERHLLGVEDAERLLGLEVAGEAVKQRGLVEVLLDPLRLEAEIRLTLGLDV